MLTYLIQSSSCLIFLYGVYHFFLQGETFFKFNRIFLLGSMILGILIPLIAPLLILAKAEAIISVQMITTDFLMVQNNVADESYSIWPSLIWSVYMIGVVIVLLKTIYGLFKIYALYKNGNKETKQGYVLVSTQDVHLPFSFFHYVFVSERISLENHIKTVLDHEEVHIRQWHTLDVLMTELIHAFFWFNPIVIFYKRALRQSHEYLADEMVCTNNPVNSYTELLLSKSQSGMEMALVNQFFQSQIKKRIQMMYSKKSNKTSLWKYAILVPVMMVLVVFFSSSKPGIEIKSEIISIQDTIPGVPKAEDLENIQQINVTDKTVEIRLKDGSAESYDLTSKAEKKAFEAKYGALPPPPPAPPAPPVPGDPNSPPAPPTIHEIKGPNDNGYILTVADNHGECVVIVKDKNEKIVKAINLVDWNKDEDKNVKKYGAIPPPPPPSAPAPPAPSLTVPTAPPAPPAPKPLFIVNGVEKSENDTNQLDPGKIASVNVVKGEKAIKKYGEKGQNGVVEIITKSGDATNGNEKVDEMPRFPGCENISDMKERDACSAKKIVGIYQCKLNVPS